MGEKILTEEVREKLLGSLPFSDDSQIDYTPMRYKNLKLPEEFTPIFSVKGFTKPERDKALKFAEKLNEKTDTEVREFIKTKIVGWKNLYDAGSMEEITYEANGNGLIKPEVLDRLPKIITSDLFFYLIKISGILDMEKTSLTF